MSILVSPTGCLNSFKLSMNMGGRGGKVSKNFGEVTKWDPIFESQLESGSQPSSS